MIGNYKQRENLKDLFFRFVEWLYLRNSDDYIFYLFSDNEVVNSLSQFLKEMNSSKRDELISFLYNIADEIDLLRLIVEHWIKEEFISCIDFKHEIYSVKYKYHIQKEDKMTFDSKKILKELYVNEETCSFKIDCVMDGDFDDIRRIIEDECEDCGVSDRLAKKVRILKNDDNCYTICCPSKEVCDLLSNRFEEIGIYGKPSNEAKDYRSSIEKYNAEDDIVEPDKSKGKVKVDGDTMYAEDGECGMTSGDAGAYEAPFEIPTKYSKKQMDMIRRGVLEIRKKQLKEDFNNWNKGFTITVKNWFYDKLYEEMESYRCLPVPEYIEEPEIGNVADHTKLRIEQVLQITDKAVKVVVEAETFGGYYKGWTTWIPKSVITDTEFNEKAVETEKRNIKESKIRRKKILKEKVFNIEVEAPTFEEIYIVENEFKWNWDEAKEHARKYHFGYSDWRLPTVEELKWIAKNVEIDSDKEGWYWSSETCRYGEEDAYIVFLTAYGNGGDVEGYYKKYDDMNTLYVRGIDSETREYLKLEKHIKKTTKESKKELNEGFKSYLTNLSDAFEEYVSETSSKGMFTLKTLKDYLLSTFDSYKKYDKNDLTEIAKNFIDEWLEKKLIGNVGYDSYAFRDLKYESKDLKESKFEFDLFDEFKKSTPKDFVIDDLIKFMKKFDETYKNYFTKDLRNFAKYFIETWKDADLIDEIDNKKYRIKTIIENRSDILKESKRLVKESVEEDLFDEFVKWYKNNENTYQKESQRAGIFSRYELNRFLANMKLDDMREYADKIIESWIEYDLISKAGKNYIITEW